MENGFILDSQVSASSIHTWSNSPPLARLNLQPASPLGSWVALSSDSYPWLQVDFLTYAKISGIITQGQADTSSFVATFTVSYGNNGKDFQNYEEFESVKVNSWKIGSDNAAFVFGFIRSTTDYTDIELAVIPL